MIFKNLPALFLFCLFLGGITNAPLFSEDFCPLQSSISKRLQVFLTENTTSGNITEADFSHGGIMSLDVQGGSGFIRQEVSDINPVHVSLPKIQVGCGGIDYHLGAFNAVASGDIKNAPLFSEDFCPQKWAGFRQERLELERGFYFFEEEEEANLLQNQLNAININSCEAGKKLAEMSSDLVRNQSIKKTICSHMTDKEGKYSNLISSRKACAVEESSKQEEGEAKENFRRFCYECVWHDLAMENYSRDQLDSAPDLLKFLSENTSSHQGVMCRDPQGKDELLSCKDAIARLKEELKGKVGTLPPILTAALADKYEYLVKLCKDLPALDLIEQTNRYFGETEEDGREGIRGIVVDRSGLIISATETENDF